MQRVFFLVPPGVHLLDITGPAHLFYEVGQLFSGPELIYLSLDGKESVVSSAGLAFSGLQSTEGLALGEQDVLFVPGLEQEQLMAPDLAPALRKFSQWLHQQWVSGATICSICTGIFLLGGSGLLNGRRCTTHWRYLDRLRQKHPLAQVIDNRLFVEADRVWSSAGVTAGIDLALHLIETKLGYAAAFKIAKEVVVYLRRSENDPQLSVFLRHRNHLDERVHNVQDYLNNNLSGDCSINQLARLVNMSPRNLSRRFKQVTGVTIGQYLKSLRAEKARTLLEQNETHAAVAAAIGLKSINQLRSILREP